MKNRKHNNYLITGGLGFIGSAIVNSLQGNSTILTKSTKNLSRLSNKKCKLLVKPLTSLTADDLQDIDSIYHCASTADNFNILIDPYKDVETNITGTIHLLELCKSLKKKPKIIYLSTYFVYGNEYDKSKVPLTEKSKTDPLGLYSITKLSVENIIVLYHRLYNIPYVIARLSNVYGLGEQYNNKKKGALNYLMMKAVRGETLEIYSGGEFIRDYIYIDDVVRALFLLESHPSGVYLVGYGQSIKFRDLIDYIVTFLGSKSKITSIPSPWLHQAIGINNIAINTAKICSLGWLPKIDYKKGVEKIIRYYSQLVA